MLLQFEKTHADAVLPVKNHATDTGMDVTCVEDFVIPAGGSAVVDVGLKVAFIEPGYWFKVEGRSGLGFKHGIMPHPGIIDEGYRGDASIKLYNLSTKDYIGSAGDRIAQFVAYVNHSVTVHEGVANDDSARGDKGFGSSGK